MSRSRKKCLTCNGCTWWLPYQTHKYTICHFCKVIYKLFPGGVLKKVENIAEEFNEVPVQIDWQVP